MQPSVPPQRIPSDPLGELLGYAREHSVALAELRGTVTTIATGHADHETRIRHLENTVTVALARAAGGWSVGKIAVGVLCAGGGTVVGSILTRLAG